MNRHDKMTERQEVLFEIFKKAISAEQKAQDLYTEAAECCDDEGIRAILKDLVIEEAKHEFQLLEIYEVVRMKLSA
jgi:rubrerythrin